MADSYAVSAYSAEEIDELLGRVEDGEIIIPSSTSGSSRKYRLTVNDSGTVSAVRVS